MKGFTIIVTPKLKVSLSVLVKSAPSVPAVPASPEAPLFSARLWQEHPNEFTKVLYFEMLSLACLGSPCIGFLNNPKPVNSIYTIHKPDSFQKGSRLWWNLKTRKKNLLQDALCRQRSQPQQEAINSLPLPGAPHPLGSPRNYELESFLREENQNRVTKPHSSYTWSIKGGSCQKLRSVWKPVHT